MLLVHPANANHFTDAVSADSIRYFISDADKKWNS